jgi:hypothetical protein
VAIVGAARQALRTAVQDLRARRQVPTHRKKLPADARHSWLAYLLGQMNAAVNSAWD